MTTGNGATNPGGNILVVDDEAMVREVVAGYLARDGFTVSIAADGTEALRRVRAEAPDLVVLDLMLPAVDGLEVLKAVREQSDLPVILLTARGDEGDRVLGLELGADDYVTKPFSPRELVARVKSVLRRASSRPGESDHLEHGALHIDLKARRVTVRGREVGLTRREFDLLAFLACSPGQVFTRPQLLRQVWDSSPEWQDPSTVTVHVRRLRNKVELDPEHPDWIKTVHGVGYRFGS